MLSSTVLLKGGSPPTVSEENVLSLPRVVLPVGQSGHGLILEVKEKCEEICQREDVLLPGSPTLPSGLLQEGWRGGVGEAGVLDQTIHLAQHLVFKQWITRCF